MNQFSAINDIKELKKAYFKLAMQHHPDKGGCEEVFKKLSNDYEERHKELSSEDNLSDSFSELVSGLMNLGNDITIELVGSWIWVSGNTKPYKEQLGKNGLGLVYARKKKMWYYHEGEYKKRGKKTKSMDEIRGKYGTTILKGQRLLA